MQGALGVRSHRDGAVVGRAAAAGGGGPGGPARPARRAAPPASRDPRHRGPARHGATTVHYDNANIALE